jgi:hypothetical protein
MQTSSPTSTPSCSPRVGGPSASSSSTVSGTRVTPGTDLISEQGVQCREREFTLEETELLREAVRQYQSVKCHWSTHSRPHHVSQASELGQEDLEDLILGEVKRGGFWTFIGTSSASSVQLSQLRCGTARGVPGRPVGSVYRHAQRLYHPYKDQKGWAEEEDFRLVG